MRLLQHDGAESISFTEDLPKDRIPPYAILSHTWGPDWDEVKYEDVINDNARRKPGYDKILFCMRQAQRDGLGYFWVDSCCIDKTTSAELSEAINSMFRWYANAEKCYVYLSDVPQRPAESSGQGSYDIWEQIFCASRWFTRGWTLQELLAPKSVEFFSKDGTRIGSRSSLERQIRDITRISIRALRGSPHAAFSVTERFSWQESRFTTREEDKYYSLLGIMDVSMPVIYGEGADKARRRLEKEVLEATKGIQSEDFLVTFSLVDVIRIDHFVSRHDELEVMKRILTSDGSRRCIVLHGLGGMGKTQLSVEYAVRYRQDYSAVFWFNIKDDDSVKSSFIKVAKQIFQDHPSTARLSGIDLKGDTDVVVDAVKAWLSLHNNTRWLLIFDNYDRPRLPGNKDSEAVDIRSYLPEAHQGFVIITTRSSEVSLGHKLSVKKLENLQDSLSILESSSQRPELMQDLDAIRLAQKLDGLPLALATAGAYLHQTPGVSCAEYLEYYETSWNRLQKTSPRLMSYEDRMLFSTWQVSYDQIAKRSPVSANLLKLWAYFGNQDIWFELLQHATTLDAPDWLLDLTTDKLDFDGYVRLLCNHGLVDREVADDSGSESQGYSVHPCVHSWTQTVLNSAWDRELSSITLCCIASHVPIHTSQQWWITSRRLLSHATSQTRTLDNDPSLYNDIHWAFHNLGLLYWNQGKLDQAEQMYQRALHGKERALGPHHTSTFDTVNNLGIIYQGQGKLDEAEQMFQRALHGKEKGLGPDHTSTLDTVANLGALYRNQGKLEKAERMHTRALQGYEEALGPDHTSTLETVYNLGNVYKDQGKLDEAEQMYAQALQGYEKALGPNHTSTLDTVNNLGALYWDQGKLDQAEPMFTRALQGKEKALGPNHTSTFLTIYNLGGLYKDQGKLDEAEQMLERAVHGLEKALGPNHTWTLTGIASLGALYREQKRLDEAEQMLHRAFQGTNQALGPDHKATLEITNNLGLLYTDQGKLDEAEEMFQRALQGYQNLSYPPQTRLDALEQSLSLVEDRRASSTAPSSRNTQQWTWTFSKPRYLPF